MSEGAWRISEVLELLLAEPNPERNVAAARALYTGLYTGSNPPECVWTGRTIRNPHQLHVDHAIPYSLWRDNSLWNLLPATDKANSAKGNKLPTLKLVRKRKEAVIGYWKIANEEHPDRFQHEAAAMVGASPKVNWKTPLFNAFCEAVETTAIRRGADRWDG